MKNNKWGFVKVAAAVPNVHLAHCAANQKEIEALYLQAEAEDVQVVCFPELSLTGYSCADLFQHQQLLRASEEALAELVKITCGKETVLIVGAPLWMSEQGKMYDCAYVLYGGRVVGVVPKRVVSNRAGKHEQRWFTSGVEASQKRVLLALQGDETVPFGRLLFKTRDFTFAVEIGEDVEGGVTNASVLAQHGAEVVFNLAAACDVLGAVDYRQQLVRSLTVRTHTGYVYASAGWGESVTDGVYSGDALICDCGDIVATSERFAMEGQLVCGEIHVEALRAECLRTVSEHVEVVKADVELVHVNNNPNVSDALVRTIDCMPFVPAVCKRETVCEEVFQIQTTALARRWMHTHSETLVLGVSGGLDSTLALLVSVLACDKLGKDRKNVVGVTMPGFGTTGRTYNNALTLMRELGVTVREISIKQAALQHFEDIGHDVNVHDITYENTQARERTQILMDVANQMKGLVVGTGDLSELALGWATYNGDHMSMYGVNADIPKTLVRTLVHHAAGKFTDNIATALLDIVSTPVSPELLPANQDGNIAQVTEDIVGPYELHDFFLYYFVRFGFSKQKIAYLAQQAFRTVYSADVIDKWLTTFMRRFFMQQFKRSCLPDGPKVGTVGLSPRGAWQMASDVDVW